MTKVETNKFKTILETKQAELVQVLRNREAIAIENSPDTVDAAQRAAERELAIRNLDRETGQLRLVRNALQRIREGSYGVCTHCEEEINPKRLRAVPWAQYCITCQDLADQRQKDLGGSQYIHIEDLPALA